MRPYTAPVVFIVVALVIAHLLAPETYHWSVNSISQLGAQTYDKAWVIRIAFIGFGLLVQIPAVRRIRISGKLWFRELPINIYGLAILLSGIFSAEPFIEAVPYSAAEANIHGALATTGGIALSLGILLYTLTDTPNKRRTAHFVALVLVTALSMLFGMMPSTAGLFQRLLWLAGFGWLLYLAPLGKGPAHPANTSSTA